MKYFEEITNEEKKYIEYAAKCALWKIQDRIRYRTRDYGNDKFYLSFSGGFESYFLFWFLKLSGLFPDGKRVEVVSCINFMLYESMKQRIRECSDVILYPSLSFQHVKEQYGIPCFTKYQDSMIHRYQNNSRREYLMKAIYGIDTTYFKLNDVAGALLMSNELHKISSQCCVKTKEEPLRKYSQENNVIPIIGVRQSESVLRRSNYTSCMGRKQDGFYPLFDITDFEMMCMYDYYDIDKVTPYDKDIYTLQDFDSCGKCFYRARTGCLGCPYGKEKGLANDFRHMTDKQRKYAISYFGESYDVIGFDYSMYLDD